MFNLTDHYYQYCQRRPITNIGNTDLPLNLSANIQIFGGCVSTKTVETHQDVFILMFLRFYVTVGQ
jgi:hypothetical protein